MLVWSFPILGVVVGGGEARFVVFGDLWYVDLYEFRCFGFVDLVLGESGWFEWEVVCLFWDT